MIQRRKVEFSLCEEETHRLIDAAENFHDAELSYLAMSSDSILSFEVRQVHWAEPPTYDSTTVFKFHCKIRSLGDCWGDDKSICDSTIDRFNLVGNKFDLLTGDGQRIGTLACVESKLEMEATTDILKMVDIRP